MAGRVQLGLGNGSPFRVGRLRSGGDGRRPRLVSLPCSISMSLFPPRLLFEHVVLERIITGDGDLSWHIPPWLYLSMHLLFGSCSGSASGSSWITLRGFVLIVGAEPGAR